MRTDAQNKTMSNAIEYGIMVKIGEKEVLVKKLNLRKIARLAEAIKVLPEQFLSEKKENINNVDFVKQLPELIMEILPKCADLVAETLDDQVSGDELLDADFEEIVGLVEAFLDVNQVAKIFERLGKVKALATGKGTK